MTREDIQKKFQVFILEKGQVPPSVYAFSKEIGIEESEFYEVYNSFHQIEELPNHGCPSIASPEL